MSSLISPESLEEHLSEGGSLAEWKSRTGCQILSGLLKKREWMVAYRSGMLNQQVSMRNRFYDRWLKLIKAPLSVFYNESGELRSVYEISEDYRDCLVSKNGHFEIASEMELSREVIRLDREIVRLGLDLKKLGVRVD